MLNQSTPIPDIYIDIIHNINSVNNVDDNSLKIKKDIIEQVFLRYKTLYPDFYSVNSKCRRPNFNDTMFKDFCNKFDFQTKQELIDLLNKCNIKKTSSNNKHFKMLEKCTKRNFYLFFYL